MNWCNKDNKMYRQNVIHTNTPSLRYSPQRIILYYETGEKMHASFEKSVQERIRSILLWQDIYH